MENLGKEKSLPYIHYFHIRKLCVRRPLDAVRHVQSAPIGIIRYTSIDPAFTTLYVSKTYNLIYRILVQSIWVLCHFGGVVVWRV